MPAPTSQPLLVLVLEPVIDAPVAVLLMVNLSLPTHPPPALPLKGTSAVLQAPILRPTELLAQALERSC